MTDFEARKQFDRILDVTDTVHVIYPEDVYVIEEVVIGWAHDRMIDAALDVHIKECGPLEDSPEADAVWEAIAKATPRPCIEDAMAFLDDIGSHTFARDTLRAGVTVNRMRDQMRAIGRPCFPKEQHNTRGAAEAQMRSIVRRSLEKDIARIHVYPCPHCKAWHVGHGR